MTEHTEPENNPSEPVEPPVGDDQPTGDDTPTDTPTTPDTAAQLAQITAERDALAQQVARLSVAVETGVPPELLQGDDEDGLRESANRLRAYVKAVGLPLPDFGAGRRDTAPPPDPDPVRRRLGR